MYEKRLAELEQQNRELQKKLDEYKEEGKEKWNSFKDKFSQNLDSLGIAIKGFFNT